MSDSLNCTERAEDLQRAAELLRRYADMVRRCHSSELERFDYIPEIEECAEIVERAALSAPAANHPEIPDSSPKTTDGAISDSAGNLKEPVAWQSTVNYDIFKRKRPDNEQDYLPLVYAAPNAATQEPSSSKEILYNSFGTPSHPATQEPVAWTWPGFEKVSEHSTGMRAISLTKQLHFTVPLYAAPNAAQAAPKTIYMQPITGGGAARVQFVSHQHIKDHPTEANPSPVRVVLVMDLTDAREVPGRSPVNESSIGFSASPAAPQEAPTEAVKAIMALVEDFADTFHKAMRPDGGLMFAEGFIAKKKKDAVRKALQSYVALRPPDGWKLVPPAPTKAMCEAGRHMLAMEDSIYGAYKAMIAAAPEAP